MALFKKFVFSLIPLLLFFGLLEGAGRVWERYDPPPRPLPIPRAAEKLPPKEPGEFRVLLYGGSTVLGDPEPRFGFENQMAHYLETVMPNRRVKLFNYAQAGQPSAYAVRMMDQSLRGSEADAIVVLSAHNEFLFIDDMRDIEVDALYAVQERLHRSAMVRRVRRLVYRYHTAVRKEAFASEKLIRVDRDSARFKERSERFERNVKTIVRLAGQADVPLFFCTGPCNLKDWGPAYASYSRYAKKPGYKDMVYQCVVLFNKGAWAELKELVMASAVKYPDDPVPIYVQAQVKMNEGATREARELFAHAKDLDRYPFRVLSSFNEVLRGQGDRSGVHIVDLEAIFDVNSPDGIAGFGLVADNCHPTPPGNRLIATSLIEAFRDNGLIAYGGDVGQLTSLDAYIRQTMTPEEYRDAQLTYLVQNAKTCLKPPYHKLVEARSYLGELLALDPDNWVGLVNLASIHYAEKNVEEGDKLIMRATDIKGSSVDMGDLDNFPMLKSSMKSSGVLKK